MNGFVSYGNPMDSLASGFALGRGILENQAQAKERQQQEEDRQRQLAARNALAQAGQTPYLFGFEDNQNALRQQWLKDLYQQNPEAALKVEQMAAVGPQEELAAKRAGDIAQKQADIKRAGFVQTLKDVEGYDQPQLAQGQAVHGQPVNAFAPRLEEPSSIGLVSEGGMGVPGGPTLVNPEGRGSTADLLSGKRLAEASGTKRIRRLSQEHGLSYEWQPMSEFEREQARTDAAQKGRDIELKGQKTAEDLRLGMQASRDKADEQVYGLQKQIQELDALSTGPGIRPADYQRRRKELTNELQASKARRDSIYFGREAPVTEATAELTPEEKAKAAAVRAGKGKIPGAPMAQPAPAVGAGVAPAARPTEADAGIGAGLPYQQQVKLKEEQQSGDIAQTRKTLTEASEDHSKLTKSKAVIDRIIQLSKEGIGSNLAGQIPFGIGEAAQRAFSQRNDELQTLRGQAIPLLLGGNNSKMMDTPKEADRLIGIFPDVGHGQDVNKRNAAIIGNDYYSSIRKSPAMDWWHRNKGSLRGFTEAWDDWRNNNHQFKITEKNGQTYLDDEPYVTEPQKWFQLRKKYSAEQIKRLEAQGLQFKD